MPSYRTIISALSVGQILVWAIMYYGFSSFVLPMQRDMGWSQPDIMGAFTLGLMVWGLATYAVGAAIDRGRGRAVLTGGALVGAAGCALWSQAHSLPLLYAAWALLGLAMAMTLYEPAFSEITKRFPDRYRQGITTITLVGGFASTLSFPAAAWLLLTLGWRPALLVMAGVLLLVAPLHAWVLRGPWKRPAVPGAVPAGEALQDHATLRQAMQGRSFWLLTATFTLYAFALSTVWAHLMPAFESRGLSQTEAVAVMVWFGPAQVAGRFAFLWLGRPLSHRSLGLMVLALFPLALMVFALGRQPLVLVGFAVLFGVANGLITIVRSNIVPDFYGREHVGRISGAMSGIALCTRAAAPFLTAWALLGLGGYTGLLWLLVGMGVVTLALFALARPPQPPA
ncbi:MAG: MFS transporter [Hydrogenophaga sp.]|uniref:MFS transporter n=1 Tax=Polaromonas sp. TaxID=1869339 RepID=UPI002731C490|nr:MFS transporter [Polaromonas sp.]MDP2449998.1 MFS transporter [Polaromonas sp.]MDP3166043.1 MFS transporter [Hydrogenophaga sp.]MDP3756814.1 MFS transporter [Polaromonas sp.]